MSLPSGKYTIRCQNNPVGPKANEPSSPGKPSKVYHGDRDISPVWDIEALPDNTYTFSNAGGQAIDIDAGLNQYYIARQDEASWHNWSVEQSPQVAVILTLRSNCESPELLKSMSFEFMPVVE
ncbi:hypothetical protein AMATHDRAFT_4845 [Amanita thiersii Skay4041]|uniref:Uncharacterized protein n=1 Tax=Amanita thiersii Skay4041 TaxID=703135 RepID=A0A2A9NP94_9AGAR|nr:hypothetical protein AMATHDRAFT_4845 [Amanita thiersii Skay4041]